MSNHEKRRNERRFKWTGRKKYAQDGQGRRGNWRVIWILAILVIIAGVTQL